MIGVRRIAKCLDGLLKHRYLSLGKGSLEDDDRANEQN